MKYLHTMIRVSHLEETLAFYTKLGFVEVKRSDYEAGRFTLIFLAAPGDEEKARQENAPLLELTYNWPDENANQEVYTQGRHFGHLAYQVKNIYDFCQMLIEYGIVINRPPRDGYMAFIKAPEGTSIELLQAGEPLEVKEPWISMENVGAW